MTPTFCCTPSTKILPTRRSALSGRRHTHTPQRSLSRSLFVKAWNKGEIRIEGEPSRIRFWLNGDLVQDFQHTKETTKGVPRTGYIALQVHPTVKTHVNYKEGNQVRYRNIRINPLDTDKSEASTKSKTGDSAK